jgi:GNAT superfamily N-acetyltransferase
MRGTAQIDIRLAGKDDCAAIARVLHESFLGYKALYTDDGFAATTPGAKQIESRMLEGPVWVALSVGLIVGTVSAVKRGNSAYIRGMAVLPATRGSGIGSGLLDHIERWASGEGLTRLFLSTTPFLASAIRLYERFGFLPTEEDPHDLFGTPLFTMQKGISPGK